MELKEKLVALRKEKGLTQLAVAEKLDVSRQAISRWESGMALPCSPNCNSSFLYSNFLERRNKDCTNRGFANGERRRLSIRKFFCEMVITEGR